MSESLAWKCYNGDEREQYIYDLLLKKAPHNPDFPMTDPTITTTFHVLFNQHPKHLKPLTRALLTHARREIQAPPQRAAH